jgi:hypothetical protein
MIWSPFSLLGRHCLLEKKKTHLSGYWVKLFSLYTNSDKWVFLSTEGLKKLSIYTTEQLSSYLEERNAMTKNFLTLQARYERRCNTSRYRSQQTISA